MLIYFFVFSAKLRLNIVSRLEVIFTFDHYSAESHYALNWVFFIKGKKTVVN